MRNFKTDTWYSSYADFETTRYALGVGVTLLNVRTCTWYSSYADFETTRYALGVEVTLLDVQNF